MITISKDKNIMNLLQIEKKLLNSMLDIQKNLNKQILQFLKSFLGNLTVDLNFDSENIAFKYINETTDILNKSKDNLDKLNSLIKKLDIIISEYSTIDIEKQISDYNNIFSKEIDLLFENTTLIESFIHKISVQNLSTILEEINNIKEDSQLSSSSLEINSELLNSSFVENTLVISEMQNKVILPYTLKDINSILFNNTDKYSSIEDVIEKIYTKPIENYKFSAISRFKEAYKLVTQKEHKSKLKGFSLATELFTNYNLHPAIITACKSLDELDIYLACLEDNTLNEFPFFDIKYEITPVFQKQENTFN